MKDEKIKNEFRPLTSLTFRNIILCIWTAFLGVGLVALLTFQYEAAHIDDPNYLGSWAFGMLCGSLFLGGLWLVGTILIIRVSE